MERYMSHIIDLMELLNPSTPLGVRSQRGKEVVEHMENMVQNIEEVSELYDKTAQLWTSL
jgi:hypothetical protein